MATIRSILDLYVTYSMRPELQSQNRVDVCYGKMVGLRAWIIKNTLEKQYFIVSEPKGDVISSKID